MTAHDHGGAATGTEIAAFYLPHFYAVAGGDEWWRTVFTSWDKVKSARPLFPEHRQPRVPDALGYYDLLDPGTHAAQYRLAQQYGVTAFCYYFHWFSGRKLLDKPLEVIRDTPELPTRYFLCWANESWAHTTDSVDMPMLAPQAHDSMADGMIVDDLASYLSDSRYVRLGGKPLLVVHRPSLFLDSCRTTDAIRSRADRLGLGELHLAMAQTAGAWDPRVYGFDSAVEIPPHGVKTSCDRVPPRFEEHPALFEADAWGGRLYYYRSAIEWCLSRPTPEFTWFRGVMPGWDDTAQRGRRANLLLGESATLFQTWVERALHHTYLMNPPTHWLLFINAWNQWAQGAYLEPDLDEGCARLETIRQALVHTAPLATALAHAQTDPATRALAGVASTYYRSSAVLAREALAWTARS